jgi:hypothetical protein
MHLATRPKPVTESKPRSLLPLVDVTLLLALITALLVTAGWAYAEAWYGRFDIGLFALEIPPVTFGIYGFKILKAHWWLLPLAIGMSAGFVWGWRWLPVRAAGWAWTAIAPLILLLFWAAHGLGAATARGDFDDHADNSFCAYPFVSIALNGAALLPDELKSLPDVLAGQQRRLLLQTPSLMVLIGAEPGVPPVMIPMDRVRMVRLTPVHPGCRP